MGCVEGPTRMLISSFDRWTSALLADDGIDMPFMGGNETISATIIAKDNGILAGCAAVDHMLQIRQEMSTYRSHGEGRSIASGDEIAKLSGEKTLCLQWREQFQHSWAIVWYCY